MPLTNSAPRKLMHRRLITCQGYLRRDGLWDIEGHLLDTKTFNFRNRDRGGEIKPGEPVHDMWLRLTMDHDFLIHDVEAVMDYSPFNLCPRIGEAFKKLKGLRIGPGWNRKTKELLGGIQGCTHLVELLGPLATTAYQTIYGAHAENEDAQPQRGKPGILDTCHALASDSEVVRDYWPRFYTGKDRAASG